MKDQPDTDSHDKNISSLYKQGSNETPAAHINQKILDEAKKQPVNLITLQIRSVIDLISSSKSLAVAAVLVISLSIILKIQFDAPEQLVPQSLEELTRQSLSDNISVQEEKLFAPVPMQAESDTLSDTTTLQESEPSPPVMRKQFKKEIQTEKKLQLLQQEKQRQKEIKLKRKKYESQRSEEKITKPAAKPAQKPLTKALDQQHLEAEQYASPSLINDLQIECENMTDQQCLSSSACILTFRNSISICQAANNHCEKDFIQNNHQANDCTSKNNCNYTKGKCKCDLYGNCQCINNHSPSCSLLIEK